MPGQGSSPASSILESYIDVFVAPVSATLVVWWRKYTGNVRTSGRIDDLTPQRDRGWRLACFDLDGTLVPGTSISMFLAERMGRGPEVAEMERRWDAQEITNAEFAEIEARALAGTTIDWVVAQLDDIPLIDGIASTVAALRERGIASVITTVTWRFAAQVIADRFGFVAATGVEMPNTAAGVLSGRIERHFDNDDKRRFAEAYAGANGFGLGHCMAVGDALSDLPLFGAVGFSVALNATPAAREAASVSLDTDDLRAVLGVMPDLTG